MLFPAGTCLLIYLDTSGTQLCLTKTLHWLLPRPSVVLCFSSCVLCWELSSLGPVLSFTGFLHIKGAFPPSTGFPSDVGWSPSLSFLAIFSN